jgi:hypothetical protein
MSTIPPTAVSPEMALVTDIRGECKEGVTPQTVCAHIQGFRITIIARSKQQLNYDKRDSLERKEADEREIFCAF